LATSGVSAIGGATLAGYVAQHIKRRSPICLDLQLHHLLGLTFILWFFVSNPVAAWSGDRNWLWTYVQLWILLWLTGRLLESPDRQRMLMGSFAIIAVLSALFGLQEVVIGESIKLTVRETGLVGNSNAAARYFTAALVFLNFFRETTSRRVIRLCTLVAIAILLVGIMFTVSRAGLLLLIVALGLILIKRAPKVHHREFGLIFVVSLVVIFATPEKYRDLVESYIIPSIEQGTDTVGLRYSLWEAGLRMSVDHPLRGIGIGRFHDNLPAYGADLLPPHRLNIIGPHNMYVAVLSETGLIGLLLFIGLLFVSFLTLWRATRLADPATASLARTWFIVLAVLLLGGLTKDDQYNKLLWIVLGIGGIPHTWDRKIEGIVVGAQAVRKATGRNASE
jgi:O-antigen ligase